MPYVILSSNVIDTLLPLSVPEPVRYVGVPYICTQLHVVTFLLLICLIRAAERTSAGRGSHNPLQQLSVVQMGVSLHFIHWHPNPPSDDIRRWGLWEVLRAGGQSPRGWDWCSYKTEQREFPSPLPHEVAATANTGLRWKRALAKH